MKNKTCSSCGASLDRNGVCHYCNNDENCYDYSQQLKTTRNKHEIRELQLEIAKEQKEINKLLENNSPNDCLKVGMSIIVAAIVIIAGAVAVFRDGDGMEYVILVSVIVLSLAYVFFKSCDDDANKKIQKEINVHQRNIKKLTKEIRNIQNGIS